MLNIFYLKYFFARQYNFFLKEMLLKLKESSDMLELEKKRSAIGHNITYNKWY